MTYDQKLVRLKKKKSIIRLLEHLYRDEDRWGIENIYPKYAEKIMRIMEAKK